MVKPKKEKKHAGIWLVIALIALVIAVIIVDFILVRTLLPRQIDDVRPGRYCSAEYLEKSEYIMVIPFFDNVSIADNKTWCSQILGLNKTIGMHGVTHSPNEFANDLDENYILNGLEEFNKCFGKYPEVFTAPQFKISENNRRFMESLQINIHGWPFAITHKLYHCVDENKTSYLERTNKIVDII